MIKKNIPICELNQLLKKSIFLSNIDFLSEFFYDYRKKPRDRLSLIEMLRMDYIQIPNLRYGIDVKTGSLFRDLIVVPPKDPTFKPANFNVIITSGMVVCRVLASYVKERDGFIQNIETCQTIVPSFSFCWYPEDISKNVFKFTTMKNGIEVSDNEDDSYFSLSTGLRIHGIVNEELLDNFL